MGPVYKLYPTENTALGVGSSSSHAVFSCVAVLYIYILYILWLFMMYILWLW